MIFVTVGTHEQPFNRLVEYIDQLGEKGMIQEDIVIQTGFSTYEPKHCRWSKFYTYQKMTQYVAEARIIITHGGPSSFIMPLQIGKIPIVVPRQSEFGEHVNDHQLIFCREVAHRNKNILLVEDISLLGTAIESYDDTVAQMPNNILSNNTFFNKKFAEIVDKIFE